MQRRDFSLYLFQLTSSGSVTFAKRADLIEFTAMLMADKYDKYLSRATGISADQRRQRSESEPILVKLYTTTFLDAGIPLYLGSLSRWFSKKVKILSAKLRINTGANDQLYQFILRKLGQGDEVQDVFENDVMYTIEGDTTIKMEHV